MLVVAHLHGRLEDNNKHGNRYKESSPWGQLADNDGVKDYLGWTTKLTHKLGPMGKCYIILLLVCETNTHPHIHTVRHHFIVTEQQALCHTLYHLSLQANKFPAGQRDSRCGIQMSCNTDLTNVNKQHNQLTQCAKRFCFTI